MHHVYNSKTYHTVKCKNENKKKTLLAKLAQHTFFKLHLSDVTKDHVALWLVTTAFFILSLCFSFDLL